MSDCGRNIGSRAYSRIADVDECASNSKRKNESTSKSTGAVSSSSSPSKRTESKFSEEEFFDSGIQSECCLSSDGISETDLKYGDSALDCGDDDDDDDDNDDHQSRRTGVKESTEEVRPRSWSKETTASKVDYKSQISAQLDSGLGIDVSCEQESQSRELVSDVQPEPSSSCAADARPSPPEDTRSSWEIFFEQDEEGNTRLHLAIIQGCQEFVHWILPRIPESRFLDIRNHRRETCLHLSVLLNQPTIARKLLLAGAKTGIEDNRGNTALHLACKANNLACVEMLLSPLSSYEQKYTVFNYRPIIDLPHSYIDEYNYEGLSCTHLAAAHPDLKVLHQLFINGCNVNIRECKGGYTILHSAVKSDNINLVRFILQHPRIDIETKNYARLTPYQLSAYYPQIAEILAEKGAIQLRTIDDESEDDESSDDESSDDESLESESERISQMRNFINVTVITTAS